MALLGLVWLGLLIAEFVWGVSGWPLWLSSAIWGVFIVEFGVRFAVARSKAGFLRRNWLELLSLGVPALRSFRALRAVRAVTAVRGLQLARVVAAFGKVKVGLADVMHQHGLGYVLALTVLVAFGGGAGMYAFERGVAQDGLNSYPEALWWTAMLLSTIGSQYWPKTAEGRVLALLIAGYALGVLGYITAALSSFLIGRDAAGRQKGSASKGEPLDALRSEVARLATQIERLRLQPGRLFDPGRARGSRHRRTHRRRGQLRSSARRSV